MRKTFVQINGELYEKGTEPRSDGHLVMGDIQPYKSMIDGSWITSRSQHREHLKAHGCQEIGNETKHLMTAYDRTTTNVAPQQRLEIIRAQVDAMSHAEFRQAIKRDADRVKWNSRER